MTGAITVVSWQRGLNMSISKFVITGGPCAGKTTALSWIQTILTQMGYTVLFVPETATELIKGGVAPWTCNTNLDYQKCQMKMQLEKEAIFELAARHMPDEKILIICDRGALDNKAYMNEEEFAECLNFVGSNEVELRDNYDAIFHLVTAAKGATEFYTTANNESRTETVEQAIALDDKTIAAWTGHPHFRIIDNTTDFKVKMRRLISEMTAFLGEPHPMGAERRFLVEYPDVEKLNQNPNCQRVEIIQTYLKSHGNDEQIRLRQRGLDGHYIYTQTTRRQVGGDQCITLERRLSQNEYLMLLMDADTTLHPIRKTRYFMTYDNQSFEIDLYPFWQDRALVEVRLGNDDTDVRMPREIKVIKEVTGDEAFDNVTLAKVM